MIAVLKALPDMTRTSLSSLVAYRAEMVLWILTSTFPVIMLALWNTVTEDQPVAGFGQVEMARYFTATLIVRQLTSAWLIWQLNFEIREGSLSMKLLKPINPLWYHATIMLTAMPFRIVVLAPFVGLLVWWKPELWATPSLTQLSLFMVSVLLAWVLSFVIQAIFASFSFWVDKTDGLFNTWFFVWMLLSGYIAPLAVFPDWSQDILYWLPFRATLAVPVDLLAGFTSPAEAVKDVGLQAAWVTAALIILSVVWRRGVRRYGAFGA